MLYNEDTILKKSSHIPHPYTPHICSEWGSLTDALWETIYNVVCGSISI